MRYTLDGRWKLGLTLPDECRFVEMDATVPGNVEIELEKNGLLENCMPQDDEFATTRFDAVDDWTYVRAFDAPQFADGWTQELVFEGIDTIADVYLNGECIYEARDMYVAHRIDVAGKLKKKDNELKVVIRSALLWARRHDTDVFGVPREATRYAGQPYLRKARHEWGWDNAPRLLTSGLYRSVYLESLPPERFDDVYLYTGEVTEDTVSIGIVWDFITPKVNLLNHFIRYTLVCEGETIYQETSRANAAQGALRLRLPREKVKLWWPRGFGEPTLHDIKLEMIENGEVRAEWSSKWGIRSIRLEHDEHIDENNCGEFVFKVNNERIFINGTNWKPLDALHSRADAKVERALQEVYDLNCNMVRIWGGGIYEDHPFFDYCDAHGLMVWHDFMFACEFPPRDEWYCKQAAWETAIILRKLRNHPSLAVWCGDNEDDSAMHWTHGESRITTSDNRITREVLRECVLRYDPYRSYVESSPVISDTIVRERRRGEVHHFQCEDHLYPATAQFAEALRSCRSRFVGETGPIMVNAMTDNERIFRMEEKRCRRLWDVPIAPEQRTNCCHQSDEYLQSWRQTGKELCEMWFGRDFAVDEWKDYATAINIICGDVFKDVIEYSRTGRWDKTGVIWWSLCDMWPMLFNYSVIDSDFHRKMPYYWIRQSQQFFALMIVRREMQGEIALYTANDTRSRHKGAYRVYIAGEDGSETTIASGRFDEAENSSRMIQRMPEGDRSELWIIEWTEKGQTHFNHFVTGSKHVDFETWRGWVNKLNALYGAE